MIASVHIDKVFGGSGRGTKTLSKFIKSSNDAMTLFDAYDAF